MKELLRRLNAARQLTVGPIHNAGELIKDLRYADHAALLDGNWFTTLNALAARKQRRNIGLTAPGRTAILPRLPDFSYHGRFVPWIFRTILGLFVPSFEFYMF